MLFPYKKVLVTGETSGIGRELAGSLVGQGIPVIALGRRQERLDELVSKYGADKVTPVTFGIANIDQIPVLTQQLIKAHPDLDLVVLKAGVQNVMDITKPHTVNIATVQNEVTVNYVAGVAFTQAFMPHFLTQKGEPAFLYSKNNVTAVVETIPYPMIFNYSATKAATRSFILSAREQLKNAGKNVRIKELYTPLVQTELHKGQPNWGSDFNPGMPVADFVTVALDGVKANQETIIVGPLAKSVWDAFEETRAQRVKPQWVAMKKVLGSAQTFD